MHYRPATDDDLDLLAEWNHQLIRDEGHRNRMTVPELRARMKGWLENDYTAVIFIDGGEPLGYGLYQETADEIYLRQFFMRCDRRRAGIGREAFGVLKNELWPRDRRLTVEVLAANTAAVQFWRAMGYRDYCLTLEILP